MNEIAKYSFDVSIDGQLNLSGIFDVCLFSGHGSGTRLLIPRGCFIRQLILDGEICPVDETYDKDFIIPLTDSVSRIQGEFSTTAPGGKEGYLRAGRWHPFIEEIESSTDYCFSLASPGDMVLITSGDPDDDGVISWRGPGPLGIAMVPGHMAVQGFEGNIELVRVRSFPGEDCREDLNIMADCAGFFLDLFGFFPGRRFVILPGRKSMTGGVPLAPGMVAIHRGAVPDEIAGDYRSFIISHEMAHQYFNRGIMKGPHRWLSIMLGLWADREYSRNRGLNPGAYRYMVRTYEEAVVRGENPGFYGNPSESCDMTIAHGRGLSFLNALEEAFGPALLHQWAVSLIRDMAGRCPGPEDFLGKINPVGAEAENLWHRWVDGNQENEAVFDGL